MLANSSTSGAASRTRKVGASSGSTIATFWLPTLIASPSSWAACARFRLILLAVS
jgi:hypothetical protein